MSQVKVYHEGKEFDVENTATLSQEMIQEVGGAGHHLTFVNLGYSLDSNQDANAKGILVGVVHLESAGGMEKLEKNVGLRGVFDETKANSAGFANLLHRHLLNATFKHFLDMEPIDISNGSVVAPYDVL